MINRVRPISDLLVERPEPVVQRPAQVAENATLYIRLPSEADPRFRKIRAIVNMFPGNNPVVLYFEDTGVRRGSRCSIAQPMVEELVRLLGKQNVVVK